MIIDEKLKEFGIDEDIINYIHVRTKLADHKIKEAEYQAVLEPYSNPDLKVLTIKLHFYYELRSHDRKFGTLDISLIKLTKLKRDIRLKQLGL